MQPAVPYQGYANCSEPEDGYSTWTTPPTSGSAPICADPSVVVGGYGSVIDSSPIFTLDTFADSLGGFFGGIDFLWMRANFDQNVAMIVDPPVGNTLVPFDYDYELSPRAWLGWQSCSGTGFRATYFRFDQSANTEAVTAVAGATPVYLFVYGAGGNLSRNANANVGQTLVSDHSLTLNSLDFEATQVVRWKRSRALFGLGVRIADMHQTSRGDVFNPDGSLEETVRNELKFQGAGPTASAQLTRGIGSSPFGIFATTRGSLLVSDTEQRIYEMKGAFTTELEDIAIQREVLGNVEFGIGVQYGQSIGRSAGMFFRAGYECQLWLDAGGPVDSHSTIGLDGITFATGVQF
ncbi:Lpg1974 family pore-forming outer membrane protein [Rubripirellula obstinata]|nr:Lpg1974 family pore-forming outer membrane protein [Rubripirellula obstinata]